MAKIIEELSAVIRSIAEKTSEVHLLSARMKTLRNILSSIEYMLKNLNVDEVSKEDLHNLETRIYELRPILLRLQFKKDGDDIERLQLFAQVRQELTTLDAALGRLRGDVGFLGLLDNSGPYYKHFSEKQRENDVKRDQYEMVNFIVDLFPYRRKKLGKTAEQVKKTDELADWIHANELIRFKSGKFLQKIDGKVKEAAEATVNIIDAEFLEHNASLESFTPEISGNIENDLRSTSPRKTVRTELRDLRIEKKQALRYLGTGTYGDVLGTTWQGRRVALKPIPLQANLSLSARAELRIETRMWQNELRHKNIIEFFGFTKVETNWYMIIEECDTSLYSLIHNNNQQQYGALDVLSRNAIIEGIASGLSALHVHNILHRNLKPNNVMIGGNARSMVKLSNFGLQVLREERPGKVFDRNTRYLPYMAPEVHPIHRIKKWSAAADIYSLGIIIWEMTQINKFPFAAEGDITKAVCQEGKRPVFDHNEGEEWIRELAATCWHQTPYLRPRAIEVASSVERHNKRNSKNGQLEKNLRYVLRNHIPGVPIISETSESGLRPTAKEIHKATIVDRLAIEIKNIENVKIALKGLVNSSKEKDNSNRKDFVELVEARDPIKLLYNVMYNFPQDAFVQSQTLNLIRAVIMTGEIDLDTVDTMNVTEKAVLAMTIHVEDKVVQFFAILLLGTLAQRGSIEFKKEIFAYNVPDCVLSTLKHHSGVELLHRYGCWTIGNFLLDTDEETKRNWLDTGMPSVLLESMQTHSKSQDLQIYALGAFINLLNKEREIMQEIFSLNTHEVVVATMKVNSAVSKILEYGSVLIAQFSAVSTNLPAMLEVDAISVLFRAVHEFKDQESVQHPAWKAIHTLCISEACLPYLLNTMKMNEKDLNTQFTGCTVITHLGNVMFNKDKFVESGCLEHVLMILTHFSNIPILTAKACEALISIAVTKLNCMAIVQYNGIESILKIMEQNAKESHVQEAALGVLGALVDVPVMQTNGSFVYTKNKAGPLWSRNAIQQRNAAAVIMYTMVNHMDSDKIITKGMWILSELALWAECGEKSLQAESTERELIDLDIADVIEYSFKKFPNNITIQRLALETVTRIAHNDVGRKFLLNREFRYINYAHECIEKYGSFADVVTAACILVGRLSCCVVCRKEHQQYNDYLGTDAKGESFLWNNETHESLCSQQGDSIVPSKLVDAVIDSLQTNGNNPGLRKAASDTLHLFCVSSRANYARILQAVLNDDELIERLPWFNEEEAWDFWERYLKEEERTLPKKVLQKRKAKRAKHLRASVHMGSKLGHSFSRLTESTRKLTRHGSSTDTLDQKRSKSSLRLTTDKTSSFQASTGSFQHQGSETSFDDLGSHSSRRMKPR